MAEINVKASADMPQGASGDLVSPALSRAGADGVSRRQGYTSLCCGSNRHLLLTVVNLTSGITGNYPSFFFSFLVPLAQYSAI